MSATNSPRPANRSARASQPDPHAIDLGWAIGRARNWLLGPAPLVANLSLFLFVGLGTVLWRLSQQPDGISLPGWLVVWGVLIAIHASVVVAWGTIHAVRTPRRGPVYYQDIPPEQRTASRRAAPVSQSPAQPAPVEAARPTWQGVLAPVTPFPTQRGPDRFGTDLPPVPDQHDFSVGGHHPPATDQIGAFEDGNPAMGQRESALADVRDVLASDQPVWRRWRRRPAGDMELAEPPVDTGSSWLSPFPGARPVTRPAPSTPPSHPHDEERDTAARPATDRRWPAIVPVTATPSQRGQSPDGEQIPSLAAMLRSSNLTSLADAPIAARPSRAAAEDGAPVPLPTAPVPFSRPTTASGTRQGTSALFTAFGIDGDGPGADRPAAPEPTPAAPDSIKATDAAENDPWSASASGRPERS